MSSSPESGPKSPLYVLALGALGVVYGDIGTSPLYALHEAFSGPHAFAVTPANILGVLSMVLWALLFVVTFKYLGFILRADNRGEGGILAPCSRPLEGAARQAAMDHRRARAVRRGAALRRRHDHSGDLGPERGQKG